MNGDGVESDIYVFQLKEGKWLTVQYAIALPAHTNAPIFRCGLYIVCSMMHQKLLSIPVYLANARVVHFRLSTMAITFNAAFAAHPAHRILFNKNLVNQRVIAIIRHTRTQTHMEFIIYNKMHFKVRATANADNNYILSLLLVRKRRRSEKIVWHLCWKSLCLRNQWKDIKWQKPVHWLIKWAFMLIKSILFVCFCECVHNLNGNR